MRGSSLICKPQIRQSSQRTNFTATSALLRTLNSLGVSGGISILNSLRSPLIRLVGQKLFNCVVIAGLQRNKKLEHSAAGQFNLNKAAASFDVICTDQLFGVDRPADICWLQGAFVPAVSNSA